MSFTLQFMKDSELRGIILQEFYNHRRAGMRRWTFHEFAGSVPFKKEDAIHICEQLAEHGLVEWESIQIEGLQQIGAGKITARGVDVIEETVPAPISINFDNSHTVNVTSSKHVQVGSGNVQGVSIHIQQLRDAIENSAATPEAREEAKGALRKFLEHPAVSAILGSLASKI